MVVFYHAISMLHCNIVIDNMSHLPYMSSVRFNRTAFAILPVPADCL